MRAHPPTRRAGLVAAVAVTAVLGPLVPAAAGPLPAAINLCRATSSDLDLNGDGYDDAVVGDPYATVAGAREAGAVVVLYGDADRRIGEGRRLVLTQASVPGSNVEAGDRFGWSVALDDATGDGCADLLVGSPGEDWRGDVDAGIVHLISFTPDGSGGPGAAHGDLLDQARLGGSVEAGDQLGWAVAIGDTGPGSEEATVAVGAPGEDLGNAADAGVVHAAFAAEFGVVQPNQWRQGGGLPGVPEDGDRFGSSLVVAPLWVSDGTDTAIEPTVVAGAPGDRVPGAGATAADGAGSVTTWDLVTSFRQQVTQESPGVPGRAEAGDAFGGSLAFGRTGMDEQGPRDVVVGVPGEDLGRVRDAGSVTLFGDHPGDGLRAEQAFDQGSATFAGSPEEGDRFGAAVALRPRGSALALVVSAPWEDVGSVADAGLVQVASVSGDGRDVVGVRAYSENSSGTPGAVTRGSRFGLALAAMSGTAESVVAVSSPHQGAGSVFVVDSDDGTRSWVPGRGGVPASSGRFGWSLGGLQTQR